MGSIIRRRASFSTAATSSPEVFLLQKAQQDLHECAMIHLPNVLEFAFANLRLISYIRLRLRIKQLEGFTKV